MKRLQNFNACNVVVISILHLILVNASGLLLLYRPSDISNDCVISHHLRYDISFGHGMSDTITLVFRTMSELDYECTVEIVTDSSNAYIVVVIRFPNAIRINCFENKDAFTVFKKNKCLRICELIEDRETNSPYFVITVRQRIRFRFLGNSSINSDMNANLYQVTATSARRKPDRGCDPKNETVCVTLDDEYCFTSGVVCDGIKNCGVADWYDERKSGCDEEVRRISYAAVIAVVAVILCIILACGHLLMRWLPPLANSFFIFNANEDNRLCIDPVFTSPDFAPSDIERAKKISIIPVSSSSSEDPSVDSETGLNLESFGNAEADLENSKEQRPSDFAEVNPARRRKTTMRAMTELLQHRLWLVAALPRRKSNKAEPTAPETL